MEELEEGLEKQRGEQRIDHYALPTSEPLIYAQFRVYIAAVAP